MQSIVDWVLRVIPDGDAGTVSAAAALLQAGAGIAVLYVTWRLTRITKQYADATDRMVLHLAVTENRRARPCVVLDFGADGNFVATNVGQGVAVNAFQINDLHAEKPSAGPLGSVQPGERLRVPGALQTELDRQLSDPFELRRFFVVAQPLGGGPWVASDNVMGRGKRISHTERDWTPSETQLKSLFPETPNEVLERMFDHARPDVPPS